MRRRFKMGDPMVPALRFKDENGQDFPDWNSKLLGQILEIGSGKDHKHLLDGDIPVYGSGGVMRHVNTFIYEGESVGIGRKGTIDNPVFLEGKFWTVDTLFYTHSFVNLLPRFLFNLFKTIEWYRYNEASGVPSLSKSTIERIRVSLPTIPEQQKIADFLSSVDKKIEQLTRKKELLEKYKTGMMQKLFPKAEEQHPELRFKDENGQDFPHWDIKYLADLANRVTKKNVLNKYTSVLTNSASLGIINQREFFDRDIANKDNLDGYYIIEKGDFVYNPRISNNAPVGPINRNHLTTGVMSPLYTVFRIIRGSLDYLEYYFFSTYWYKYMYSVANYGARHDRMNITVKDFMKLPLPIPSLPEQQKIADFLSAIDDKITKVEGKLTKAQTFKKGLLQQMFV